MFKSFKPSAVALLLLVLQLGMAHAMQHDLHAFDPSTLTQAHDEADCLLVDTPQAEADLPLMHAVFARPSPQQIAFRTILPTPHISNARPRAPPFSL
jgi:hypothetical protein